MWMNEHEIDQAVSRCQQETALSRNPHLVRATVILSRLRDKVNSMSDGWAYWNPPSRAAEKLQTLIQNAIRFDDRKLPTEADLKAALSPIKAFCTKHKVNFDELDPSKDKPAPTFYKATYSRHYKPNAVGHICIDKPGACTIELVGAASMSQEELDFFGAKIAAALNENVSSDDVKDFKPRL